MMGLERILQTGLFTLIMVLNMYQHELTDPLSQGVGYWIIQNSGSDKTLEMPIGSATTPTTTPAGCSSTNCFSIPLLTEVGGEKFNLLGYPYGIESDIFRKPYSCG